MTDEKEIPSFSDSFPTEWIDANYQLMPREVQSLDKIVHGVVRARAVANKIFPTVRIPKGTKKYTVATEVEQDEPTFDDNFMRENIREVRKGEEDFYPAFMHTDFSLYMTDIDASRNQKYYNMDLKALTLRGATATIAEYKEKVLWRGYDITGRALARANRQGSIDTNVAGIVSNIQRFRAGIGADDNVTAEGDGPASVGLGAADLVVNHYYGPFDFVMTPMVYAQLLVNQNATTRMSDIERMMSLVDTNKQKIIRQIHITPHLLGVAETTALGSILMCDRKTPDGEPVAVIGDEYPIAHYPTSQNQLGVKGKVLWAGVACVLRPLAFTLATSITN